uniref:Cap-specific mRNA (nucleoside-2'-O-)-methyltransferase n=1 Tax=Pithovirus LCPAC101 TaxID=2506586 RepID=A0A481Z396_9VIRU|nr:MAG: poly a polymerase regulatory subunit [Pithovirus LCPAC101]
MSNSKFQEFSPADAFVQPNDETRKYESLREYNSAHWGQRKLGLMLVQFLTLYWDPLVVKYPVVVYVGAADGVNIGLASELFPTIRWRLYDPRPFKITPDKYKDIDINGEKEKNIIIYNQLFMDDDASGWAKKQKQNKNIYFISDIRGEQEGDEGSVSLKNEIEIWENMKSQQRWYEIIRPVHAHFKFRLPYNSENTKSTFKRYVPFLDGDLYKGVWAPHHSTECRLVPKGYDIKYWDIVSYEEKLFYFNTKVRGITKYYNPYYDIKNKREAESPIDIENGELLNDWDSLSETYIWKNYLNKMYGSKADTLDRVLKLTYWFTEGINEGMKSTRNIVKLRLASIIKSLVSRYIDQRIQLNIKLSLNITEEDKDIISKYKKYVIPYIKKYKIGKNLTPSDTIKIATELYKKGISIADIST